MESHNYLLLQCPKAGVRLMVRMVCEITDVLKIRTDNVRCELIL